MYAIFLYPIYSFVFYMVVMLGCFALHSFLPNCPPILGFIARCMSGYLILIISASYGTIASAVLRPFGLHYKYAQWTTARCFKWLGLLIMGIKFEILDDGVGLLNKKRPMVLISNHQTELDILLLGYIWPRHCSVTAKKSLRNTPFLGWFMTLSGSIFIDRVDRAQAMKAFEGAAIAMRDLGQSVLIFPEGTRSYSAEPTLLPFKKGAFHLAVQSGADILPIVAENYSRVLNVKALRFNSGTIRVKVLDPISTKGFTAADVDKLTTDTREKMLQTLVDLAKTTNSQSDAKKVK